MCQQEVIIQNYPVNLSAINSGLLKSTFCIFGKKLHRNKDKIQKFISRGR